MRHGRPVIPAMDLAALAGGLVFLAPGEEPHQNHRALLEWALDFGLPPASRAGARIPARGDGSFELPFWNPEGTMHSASLSFHLFYDKSSKYRNINYLLFHGKFRTLNIPEWRYCTNLYHVYKVRFGGHSHESVLETAIDYFSPISMLIFPWYYCWL